MDHRSGFQGEVANPRRGSQKARKSNGLCILSAGEECDLLSSHKSDCSLGDGSIN